MTSIVFPINATSIVHDARLEAERSYEALHVPASVHDRYIDTFSAHLIAERLIRAEDRIRELEAQ